MELSEWNCELSVCEYFFVKFRPSVVAISAILNGEIMWAKELARS